MMNKLNEMAEIAGETLSTEGIYSSLESYDDGETVKTTEIVPETSESVLELPEIVCALETAPEF